MMDNLEKYNKVFIKNLQVTEDQLETLAYQSVSAWDSVGHMVLVAGMEETFNILLEPNDIIDFSSYLKGKQILQKYDVSL